MDTAKQMFIKYKTPKGQIREKQFQFDFSPPSQEELDQAVIGTIFSGKVIPKRGASQKMTVRVIAEKEFQYEMPCYDIDPNKGIIQNGTKIKKSRFLIVEEVTP